MKRLLCIVGLLLSMGLPPAAQALQILRWERLPLAVPLNVGQERVIFIDRNVRVGVPASVGARLRVQSAGGAIYLRASEPIAPTRLQLQDADTGALILLDIVAQAAQQQQTELEPVRIIKAETAPVRYGGDPHTVAGASADSETQATAPSQVARETPIPVVLTRFAAQNLYAPLRTVEPVAGITRVNPKRTMALDTLLPTLPVRARALAAWRLDDWWVTAVRLSNTSGRWLNVDPRELQGDFTTGTFQHTTLGPTGTPEDTTVVYLVTRRHGLAESLLPAVSPINAAHNLPQPTMPVVKDGGRHER